MTEIVSGVLKLTFGFLASKARNKISECLRDGDVTDEECRRLIVRELDDIKGKLDGLARTDLLASLCFLREGVNGLYQCLIQCKSNENTAESSEQETLVEAASSRGTGPDSPINEATALINAITSLKADGTFESAMESFKLARENATKAFCNEALSIEDRIQASQVRIAARILEKLECADAGVSDCLQYLTELHNIGAIREIFSVLIDGGFKSRFNKIERLNNASSVQLMNQQLFDFARKFTKLPPKIFDWPTIMFDEKCYHPVFGEYRLAKKLEESGVTIMSPYPDFTFGDEIVPSRSVVNSKREIIAKMPEKNTIKIFKPSGESRTLCEVPKEEHASKCYVVAMDIDAEDNLFVITGFEESDNQPWNFKLFIFHENGNEKLESPLPFHQNYNCIPDVRMTINYKDGKIAILDKAKKILYIGNICIELKLFTIDKSFLLKKFSSNWCGNIRFLDINETKIIAAFDDTVYIYTEDGELERKIKIPEGHGRIESVAINHIIKRIVVKTWLSIPYNLFSFSETGELTDSLCLGSSEWVRFAKLSSHPNGAVVLVGERGATLLQQ